jgi:hypothetical protein
VPPRSGVAKRPLREPQSAPDTGRAHRGIASVAWTLGALAEDGVRPIIFYNRVAYCRQPQVKGWSMMVNSIINNWRMEDVWLDR